MSKKVFEKKDWNVMLGSDLNEMAVFANHGTCPNSPGGANEGERGPVMMNSWWTGDLYQICIICDVKVPDEIQALVMLLDYDRGE